MTPPSDLVAIPPLYRTVIYYALAVTLVVVGALVQSFVLAPVYLVITSGVGGVFFGVAGSNVTAAPPTDDAAPAVVEAPEQEN